jgi:hypothetical protein
MSYKLDSDVVAGYWSGKVTAYYRPAAEKVPLLSSLPFES